MDEIGISSFGYDNSAEPMAQFEGILANEGGSLEDFGFTTDPAGGTRIVYGTNDPDQYKAYVARLSGVTTSQGGYVHFLGGHEYKDPNIGEINGRRILLNAVLRSAERPSECNLSLGPIALDDTGTIDCGQSVTVNVLSNDSDPLGGPLTVSLVGNGSYGNFVNNNDGTITYTPNPGAWLGPDTVTYQACSNNNLCDEALLIISGGNEVEIAGTVFQDDNLDGLLHNGEPGQSGVQVNLYVDNNNDGQVDGGDSFVASQNTAGDGSYQFILNSVPFPTNTVTFSNQIVNDDSWEKDNGDNFPSAAESGDKIRYKGYRWTNLNIPANATITSATMRVTGYDFGNIPVAIKAENLKVPPAYQSSDDYLSTRSVTSAAVTWNVPSLNDNVNYTSPDFSSVVQELVNTHGGITHLSLILSNTSGSWVVWNLDDGVSAKYQRLNLTYTIPGDPINYVLNITPATLPAGSSLTTDNVETATFSQLGQLDCDNNFGFDVSADFVLTKDFVSAVNNGNGTFDVIYNITVQNTGGKTGTYDLTDTPAFDDAVQINSASFTYQGGVSQALAGAGPWPLAQDSTLEADSAVVYRLTVNVQLDFSNNKTYDACQGTNTPGTGLYNRADLDDLGSTDTEVSEDCGDLDASFEISKTFQSAVRTAPGVFAVTYQIKVSNVGGSTGTYTLKDQPSFDSDIAIDSARYSRNTIDQGLVSPLTAPWTLATNASLAGGAMDIYMLTVYVHLELEDNIGDELLSDCNFNQMGQPQPGFGTYNLAWLDDNNNDQVDGNEPSDDSCGNLNDVPVANPDFATTTEDNPVTIDVLDNDDFGNDGPSTKDIVVTSQPSNGAAVVDDQGDDDPTNDQITYTPNNGFFGTDTFIYEIEDSNGDTDTALVTVVIEECVLDFSAMATTPTTNGGNDGTISISPTGGVGPYTYSWLEINTNATGSGNGLMISNLPAGTYEVTLADSKGCEATVQVEVPAFDCVPNKGIIQLKKAN